jgi:hypothetical protein
MPRLVLLASGTRFFCDLICKMQELLLLPLLLLLLLRFLVVV